MSEENGSLDSILSSIWGALSDLLSSILEELASIWEGLPF
jgi:hypothetical protein